MSTIGIVALSLLVGAFIILVIGLCAWLVWLLIKFRADITMLRSTIGAFSDDTGNLLTLHRSEIRSAFTTHHQEFAGEISRLGTILDTHYARTHEQIASINGRQLAEAVVKFSTLVEKQRAAAGRIESAAVAFGTLARHMLSEGALRDADASVATDVTTDGFAANPTGERWTGTSRVAADDAAVLANESDENTGEDI